MAGKIGVPSGGRIPNSEFTSRPWRIHEFIPDFVIEDVWACPTPGGPDDLAAFVWNETERRTTSDTHPIVRALFAVRWRLGKVLGWDTARQQVGKRTSSLRDRLPPDLLATRGPDMRATPMRSVYQTHDEWTAEFSAAMGHIVMHNGWVQGADGTYYCQMTALIKIHGLFGKIYMYGISPIRRYLVYPLMFRSERREWPEVLRQWESRGRGTHKETSQSDPASE